MIQWILIGSGSAFLLGYLAMLSQWQRRPFFNDEVIYVGQYFYGVLERKQALFWTVDTKQPLLFWIYSIVYHFFPGTISEGPLFSFEMGRLLSYVFVFGACLAISDFSAFGVGGERRILAFLSVCLVVLSSPFIQIHSQLIMVEPLLILTASLTLLAYDRYLKSPNRFDAVSFLVSGFLLIMTKANGLFVLGGIAAVSLLFLLRRDQARVKAYRNTAILSVAMFVAGFVFLKLNPGLRMEANRVMKFPGFSLSGIFHRLRSYPSIAAYHLSYSALAVLSFGLWKACRERPRISSLFIALVFTSLLSALATLLSMDGGVPRYHVLTYFPWLLVAALSIPSLLKERGFAPVLLLAALADFHAALPAFVDVRSPPSRVHGDDLRQYYDHFSVESVVGLNERLVSENAEIYAHTEDYQMDGLILRSVLGERESVRIKPLPVKLSDIACNPAYGATYVWMGKWLEWGPVDSSLVKIREYAARKSDGASFTLYRKTCSNAAVQRVKST